MGKHDEHISDALGVDNVIEKPEKDTSQLGLFDDTSEQETQNVPAVVEEQQVEIIPNDQSIKDARQDYTEVRGALHRLNLMGFQALEGIMDVAQESEHPRAYEVMATTMKNLAENTEKLMKLHHDMQDLEDKKNKQIDERNSRNNPKSSEQDGIKHVTNNAVFVGSNSELQKFLAKERKRVLGDDD